MPLIRDVMSHAPTRSLFTQHVLSSFFFSVQWYLAAERNSHEENSSLGARVEWQASGGSKRGGGGLEAQGRCFVYKDSRKVRIEDSLRQVRGLNLFACYKEKEREGE